MKSIVLQMKISFKKCLVVSMRIISSLELMVEFEPIVEYVTEISLITL